MSLRSNGSLRRADRRNRATGDSEYSSGNRMPDHTHASRVQPRCLSGALGVIAAAILAGACRSTPAPQAAPPKTVSADTWAVVDGRPITRDDVEKAYRRTGDATAALSDEEALTAKLNLLNELIVQDVLLAKARELKIEVTDADVDKAYAETKKRGSDEAFQQELTRRHLTAADMR